MALVTQVRLICLQFRFRPFLLFMRFYMTVCTSIAQGSVSDLSLVLVGMTLAAELIIGGLRKCRTAQDKSNPH